MIIQFGGARRSAGERVVAREAKALVVSARWGVAGRCGWRDAPAISGRGSANDNVVLPILWG